MASYPNHPDTCHPRGSIAKVPTRIHIQEPVAYLM